MKLISSMIVWGVSITLWIGISLADDNRFIISDLTMKDKTTGLIWTRNANMGKLEWGKALELVNDLNGKGYAGAKDWRLPSREEFKSLMLYALSFGYDGGQKTPSPYNLFNKIGFSDVQLCEYLTSNPRDHDPYFTWVISTFDGTERNEKKEHEFCVWPVRVGE